MPLAGGAGYIDAGLSAFAGDRFAVRRLRMIHVGLITANIIEEVAYLAATPLLWLFLYLFAWVDKDRARAAGFGRTTFWLLVGGGILGFIGELPILPIGQYILGVNVAGGLIPLVLSGLLLARLAPGATTPARWFLVLLTVETAASLLAAILVPAVAWIVVIAAAAAIGAAGAVLLRGTAAGRVFAATLALVSATIVMTYLATESEPGFGITSQFPYYLLAPIGVAVAAVAVAERLNLGRVAGLPMAYASATIGVLIGADVLRQPPLYGPGPGAFYVIGGAGPEDLLYLSGLIALASAWAFERFVHRPKGLPELGPAPTPRAPEDLLRNSLHVAMSGDPSSAVRLAGDAADSAAGRARLLLGAPPPPPDAPWSGLAVPAWVELDHRNLRALVTSPERRPRDAARAWWTARWLVRLGRELSRTRFARAGPRLAAGTVDALVMAVPTLLVFVVLVETSTVSNSTFLDGAAYNAAAIGYAAWAFVYFVVAESGYGTTLGKRLFGLAVTDRSLQRPTLVPAMLRNAPKLLPLTIIGVVGADLVFLLVRGVGGLGITGPSFFPDLAIATVFLFLILLGVGLPTAAGGLTMSLTAERQRVGDLLAGTWVVTTRPPIPPAPPGWVAPPGAPRSG
ncbi:MAG: RDD family protein [Thermoplasmata archaeon]|nr:RDD family protein [Thermoplasmata archaeon]